MYGQKLDLSSADSTTLSRYLPILGRIVESSGLQLVQNWVSDEVHDHGRTVFSSVVLIPETQDCGTEKAVEVMITTKLFDSCLRDAARRPPHPRGNSSYKVQSKTSPQLS